MDVRQLSTLVAIADHGTFSAAARALYTVQSNVSAHIARLEKELGVTLVDRANGGLTDDGGRVVERARRILSEIDDITSDMMSHAADVSGQTRVGVIGTTARWLMPQLLSRLEADHPNVRAVISESPTSSLVPAVINGGLNGAIVHLPVDDAELMIEPLFAEDLFLLAAESHPLATLGDEIPLAALDDVPLLLPPTGSSLRKVLDRAANNAGVRLLPQAEIDGVRLLASLAFDGFGAAIVPSTAAPNWVEGAFRRITVPELPRRVVAFVRRRRPGPSAPTTAALEVLRDVIRESGPHQPGVYPNAGAFARHRGQPDPAGPGEAAGGGTVLQMTALDEPPFGLSRLVPSDAGAEVRQFGGRAVVWAEFPESDDAARLSSRTSSILERAMRVALDESFPLVLVVATTGADIVEGVAALHAWGAPPPR